MNLQAMDPNICAAHEGCSRLGRRSFLRLSTAVAVGGLLGGGLPDRPACGDALTKEQRDKKTPDDVLALMRRGNERFRTGVKQVRNYLNEQKASAKGQYPAAVILSCIASGAACCASWSRRAPSRSPARCTTWRPQRWSSLLDPPC